MKRKIVKKPKVFKKRRPLMRRKTQDEIEEESPELISDEPEKEEIKETKEISEVEEKLGNEPRIITFNGITLTPMQVGPYNAMSIENKGDSTIRDLKISIIYDPQGGGEEVTHPVAEFFQISDYGMRGKYAKFDAFEPRAHYQFRLPSKKSVRGDIVQVQVKADGIDQTIKHKLKS
jgi:hypothetical protein